MADKSAYSSYVDDDDLITGPSDGQLQRVSELAALQITQEALVASLEAELDTAKENLKQTAERDLPNLMEDIGLLEYKLTNGTKISIKAKAIGNILAANREVAFEWFHKNGFGPLVKRDVEVQFGRGDSKKAGKLLGYLKRWYKDFKISDKEAIHGGTLNAWAREILERNAAALRDGGKIIELPEEIKIIELRASVIALPK